MIEKSLIEKESAAVPSQHIVCCSLVANRLMDIEINGGSVSYEISSTTLTCALTTTDGKKGYLSGYDLAVLEALHTIWEYGREDHIISLGSIYRVMVHNTDFDTPSEKNLVRVRESLELLHKIYLTVGTEPEIHEPLVQIAVSSSAKKIAAEPVVLRYSKELRQVKTVPADLLAVRDENGKIIPNRGIFVDLRERLLRQVVIQSRTNRKAHLITLETMIGKRYKTLSAKQKRGIVEHINQILNDWKRKAFIKSYSFRQKGRTIDAVQVDFT